MDAHHTSCIVPGIAAVTELYSRSMRWHAIYYAVSCRVPVAFSSPNQGGRTTTRVDLGCGSVHEDATGDQTR